MITYTNQKGGIVITRAEFATLIAAREIEKAAKDVEHAKAAVQALQDAEIAKAKAAHDAKVAKIAKGLGQAEVHEALPTQYADMLTCFADAKRIALQQGVVTKKLKRKNTAAKIKARWLDLKATLIAEFEKAWAVYRFAEAMLTDAFVGWKAKQSV